MEPAPVRTKQASNFASRKASYGAATLGNSFPERQPSRRVKLKRRSRYLRSSFLYTLQPERNTREAAVPPTNCICRVTHYCPDTSLTFLKKPR